MILFYIEANIRHLATSLYKNKNQCIYVYILCVPKLFIPKSLVLNKSGYFLNRCSTYDLVMQTKYY